METMAPPSSGSPLEIQAPAPFQWGALLCSVLALASLGFSLTVAKHQKIWALLAVGPALCAIALVATRKGPFAAVCHETAIELTGPQALTLPWEKIVRVIVADRKPLALHKPARKNFTIRVVHADGEFDIPRNINLESDRVLHYLLERVPVSGSREMPQQLATHLQQCLEQFGPEHVLSYRGRRQVWLPWSVRKRLLALGVALAAVAAAWIAPLELPLTLFGGFAAYASFVLLVCAIPIYRAHPRQAGLVLSPQGLAIYQKPYFGYADWHEVTGIEMRRSVNVTIEEQKFPIYDAYDRPGLIIYSQMLKYWRQAHLAQGVMDVAHLDQEAEAEDTHLAS